MQGWQRLPAFSAWWTFCDGAPRRRGRPERRFRSDCCACNQWSCSTFCVGLPRRTVRGRWADGSRETNSVLAVFAWAADDGRVLISGDTDLGRLFIGAEVRWPSLILFRREDDRRAATRAGLILSNYRSRSGHRVDLNRKPREQVACPSPTPADRPHHQGRSSPSSASGSGGTSPPAPTRKPSGSPSSTKPSCRGPTERTSTRCSTVSTGSATASPTTNISSTRAYPHDAPTSRPSPAHSLPTWPATSRPPQRPYCFSLIARRPDPMRRRCSAGPVR